MPPKPQVFKTPDGKEFDKKSEWRDYMVETFYSFKNKTDETAPLIKPPGAVQGQMFTIENCTGCTLALCDQSEQVHIDRVKNCRIFIGACASSIFIRNCEDCVFYCCSQQLRLRECFRCKFYVFSVAEVHIEMSKNVEFGPFRGGYPEHGDHLKTARLDTEHNLWYDIYDHNDSLKTKDNWSLINPAEYEIPWFPMGECEPALVATAPGAVDRSNESDANMSSFGIDQLKVDSAPKIAESLPTSADAVPAPPAPVMLAPTSSLAQPDAPLPDPVVVPAAVMIEDLPPPPDNGAVSAVLPPPVLPA